MHQYVSPSAGALGAALIAVAVNVQPEGDLSAFWRALLETVAQHWQVVLLLVRALGLGLASAFFLGASPQDFVITSPVLVCMSFSAAFLIFLLFRAAAVSAVVGHHHKATAGG